MLMSSRNLKSAALTLAVTGSLATSAPAFAAAGPGIGFNPSVGLGFYAAQSYGYYSSDGYGAGGDCTIQRRAVTTPHGYRYRNVRVCY